MTISHAHHWRYQGANNNQMTNKLIQGIQAKALQNENTFNAIGIKLL